MKILAVDTSGPVDAVAVAEDTIMLGEYNINHKRAHSQKLAPMISHILGELGLKPGDIDIYAASIGPGSFTGLRIGITTVKAMAYAAGKPVISVPTLDALAYNISVCDWLICPIIDARNNQVYTAMYKWENGIQKKITEYMGIDVIELISLAGSRNSKVIFNGDGVNIHRTALKRELGER